jgi:hypothetical protein
MVWLAASTALSSCAVDSGLFWTGVPNDVQAEIRLAMRSVTTSPVDGIQHNADWPPNEYLVATKDGKYWHARKWRGHWSFKEAVIVVDTQRSNQSMKPTAPLRGNFSVFATTPCRGLSLSR